METVSPMWVLGISGSIILLLIGTVIALLKYIGKEEKGALNKTLEELGRTLQEHTIERKELSIALNKLSTFVEKLDGTIQGVERDSTARSLQFSKRLDEQHEMIMVNKKEVKETTDLIRARAHVHWNKTLGMKAKIEEMGKRLLAIRRKLEMEPELDSNEWKFLDNNWDLPSYVLKETMIL